MRTHACIAVVLAVLGAAAGPGAAAQTVSLNGSMGTRQALLVIDGRPRVVEVGASVMGVRLISLSATQAEVDVAGQRRLLLRGHRFDLFHRRCFLGALLVGCADRWSHEQAEDQE